MNVLYIEDEPLLARIVKDSLESRGLKIDWFTDASQAEDALADAAEYDIAVLDVQLPGEDGFSIGKRLRAGHPRLPILYLTARVQAKDALDGFEAGGNDYVRKPFSMEELLVRMRNLVDLTGTAVDARESSRASPPLERELRRGQVREDNDVFTFASFTFDYPALRLTHRAKDGSDSAQTLSHREAELLRLFLRAHGQEVIERKKILLEIWHDDGFFNSRNLDVYVRKVRSLLEADPGVRILTLRGVGYRFVIE